MSGETSVVSIGIDKLRMEVTRDGTWFLVKGKAVLATYK